MLDKKDQVFQKDDNNKYLVETIWFDDILAYFPKNKENKKYERAILKIDIEGFEPYAFMHAKELFDSIDIPVIFMEWGNFPKQHDAHTEIKNMIDFLLSYKLIPYGNNMALRKESWLTWPWDIVWKKAGF